MAELDRLVADVQITGTAKAADAANDVRLWHWSSYNGDHDRTISEVERLEDRLTEEARADVGPRSSAR